MSQSDTQKQYEAKQAEYQQMLKAAVEHRDREKTLRKEFDAKLKEALQDHGLDGEAMKNQKRLLTAQLHDLKQQLIGEIVADVSIGNITKGEGVTALQRLDYTEAAAEIELKRATGEPLRAEAPLPQSESTILLDPYARQPAGAAMTTTIVQDPAGNPVQGQQVVSVGSGAPEQVAAAAKLKAAEDDRLAKQKLIEDEETAAERRELERLAAEQRAQETPEAKAAREKTDRDAAIAARPEVAPGKYQQVSNANLAEHVKTNEAELRAEYGDTVPEDRPGIIAALVKLRIAPPVKSA